MTSCDQFREQHEAYALGALDAEERAPLEAHLAAGCKDCAKSVEEARWLVSQLAYLAPEAAPSDMLKRRLLRTLRAETQPAQRSVPSRSSIPIWMWAGVAALFLMTAYSAWTTQRLQREIEEANSQARFLQQERQKIEGQLMEARHEAAILTDRSSVTIGLFSPDHLIPQLEAKWHPQLGIVVSGQKVPAPPGNRVLQLWLIPKATAAKPVPSLTLRPDADGRFALMVANPPEIIANTKALAITEEPAGGSPQPTTAPRWVGGVS